MSSCTICACGQFTPKAFQKTKCLECNHTDAQHQPPAATDKPDPTNTPPPAMPPMMAASPMPPKLPPPAPPAMAASVANHAPPPVPAAPSAAATTTLQTETMAVDEGRPSQPSRKTSLPPPLPPGFQKQTSVGAETPAAAAATAGPSEQLAASVAPAPTPVTTTGRAPPPRQSIMRAPPPPPPSGSGLSSGQHPPPPTSSATSAPPPTREMPPLPPAFLTSATPVSTPTKPGPPPMPASVSGGFPSAGSRVPPPPTTRAPAMTVLGGPAPGPTPAPRNGPPSPGMAHKQGSMGARSTPPATPATASTVSTVPPPPPHIRTESSSQLSETSAAYSPSLGGSPASRTNATGGSNNNMFSPFSPTMSPSPEATKVAHRPPIPGREKTLPASSSNATAPPTLPSATAPPTPSAAAAVAAAGGGLSAAAASPSSGASQWVDPNYLPSFAQRLHHKFDVVVEQSAAGMRLVKRVRAFMQRFSSLQERYASELQKITSVERNKLIAMPRPDQMSSCYTAWLGFFENMDKLSAANATFSQELKEITVEQLERWYTIGGQMVKDQKLEQERVQAAMLKVNVAVAKEREQATQALQKLASKRSDADTPGSSGGGGGGSGASGAHHNSGKERAEKFMKGLFESASSGNPQKAFEKSREAAMRACESYTTALQSANASHHRYHTEELPGMLTQMQSLEEMRLHSLNSALRDFSRLQKSFTSSMSSISGVVEELAARMDANQDIYGFVASVVMAHGPALPPVPFTYDLPLSLAELQNLRFDEPPSSLFYSTVDGVMKHQKSMENAVGTTASSVVNGGGTAGTPSMRHASLELPLIVPTLLRSIYENDGMHSEGIFRLSVGSEELTRIRRQLESGDFGLKEGNPHVAACLLKSWFRDLLSPVFPWSVYERCIQVGQVEPWDSDNPGCAIQVKTIMQDLPPLHEKIVALLFGFLKRLADEPTYVAKTRMNLANLALVFSPGLVRSEKNDPMQMLQDTKYASNFVLRAIECSPGCFSTDSQQCAQTLLDEIFSGNVVAQA